MLEKALHAGPPKNLAFFTSTRSSVSASSERTVWLGFYGMLSKFIHAGWKACCAGSRRKFILLGYPCCSVLNSNLGYDIFRQTMFFVSDPSRSSLISFLFTTDKKLNFLWELQRRYQRSKCNSEPVFGRLRFVTANVLPEIKTSFRFIRLLVPARYVWTFLYFFLFSTIVISYFYKWSESFSICDLCLV